jgi:hypothetical protein
MFALAWLACGLSDFYEDFAHEHAVSPIWRRQGPSIEGPPNGGCFVPNASWLVHKDSYRLTIQGVVIYVLNLCEFNTRFRR